MTRDRLGYPLVLLAFAAVLIGASALTTIPFDPETACCDHLFYWAMAGGPSDPSAYPQLQSVYSNSESPWGHPENGLVSQPPYAYRPLAPLIARVLGFYPLTVLCLTLAAWLLGVTAWRLTARPVLGALGIVLFVLNPWLVGFNLWDYMLVDPLAYLFFGLGVLCLVEGRYGIALDVVAVGLFAKESLGFLLPCVLLAAALERRLSWRLVWLAALAIVPYLAFRGLLPIPIDDYSLSSSFIPWPRPEFLGAVLGAFGVLWPLLPLGMLHDRRLIALLPLLLSGIFAALFATDVGRAVAYAYPLLALAPVLLLASQSSAARNTAGSRYLRPG